MSAQIVFECLSLFLFFDLTIIYIYILPVFLSIWQTPVQFSAWIDDCNGDGPSGRVVFQNMVQLKQSVTQSEHRDQSSNPLKTFTKRRHAARMYTSAACLIFCSAS